MAPLFTAYDLTCYSKVIPCHLAHLPRRSENGTSSDGENLAVNEARPTPAIPVHSLRYSQKSHVCRISAVQAHSRFNFQQQLRISEWKHHQNEERSKIKELFIYISEDRGWVGECVHGKNSFTIPRSPSTFVISARELSFVRLQRQTETQSSTLTHSVREGHIHQM